MTCPRPRASALYLSACLAMLGIGWIESSHAGPLVISPVRLAITPAHKIETLSLRNPGQTPAEYELELQSWSMHEDGRWLLDVPRSPVIAVFPLSVRIEPGKTQLVRVGLTSAIAPGPELAYRLLIRALPSASESEQAGLSVRTNFSVPIFVGAANAPAGIAIDPGKVLQGRWQFRVLASGPGHLIPGKAKLRLFDADNALVSPEQEIGLGYVLAGAALPVEVRITASACARAQRFEIEGALPLGRQAGLLPAAKGRTCAG